MAEARLAKSGRELRAEVEGLIRDDLIGPLGGPEEELHEPPVDRYLLGLLAPQLSPDGAPHADAARDGSDDNENPVAADAQSEDDLAGVPEPGDSSEEGVAEDRPPAADQLVPSAFGLTFALADDCREVTVSAEWGAYSRQVSEEKTDVDGRPARVWRRRRCGGTAILTIAGPGALAPFAPDREESEVVVRGLVRERDGHRLVSLFLVNGQVAEGGRSVDRWLCQASLTVGSADGTPVFVRRPIDLAALAPAVDHEELAGLEMLYRSSVELAVGHGIAVEVTTAPGPARPWCPPPDRGDARRGGAAHRGANLRRLRPRRDPRTLPRRARGAGHAHAERGLRRRARPAPHAARRGLRGVDRDGGGPP